MIEVLDSNQMRACDENTIKNHKLPSLCLMEKAATSVFEEIIERFTTDSPVNIICGPGNNGGDGVAVARLLYLYGFEVAVLVLGDENKYSEQLLTEIAIAKSYDVPFVSSIDELEPAEVIVDAIFGIGLTREVTGTYLEAIEYINSEDSFVVAVDIPSGFCSDSGNLLGAGVNADLTVTFAYPKKGLLLSDCRLSSGEVIIADVGIYLDSEPEGVLTHSLEEEDLILIPSRPQNANKGSCGKLLVIAGSKDIYGACYLSAKAAMVTGSGLVKIYTHTNNITSIQQGLPEAMYASYEDFDEESLKLSLEWADAVILGPGLGTGEVSKSIVEYVMKNTSVPTLVDADGINLLAKDLTLIDNCMAPVVLTPHLKEMERLSGVPVSEINKKMEVTALEFVKDHPSILVLKNYVTLITTSPTENYINDSGNEALATAGSGDVLAGIIGSLLGQGLEAATAAPLGTFIHGLAGEYASENKGVYGVLASDIIQSITEVM